jgi:predicted lipid-binding transport protein (Tim44 family)
MAKQPKKYDDDDGRTIANMNVEGMPWYIDREDRNEDGTEKPELSKRETLSFMGGALKAALLVGLIFVAVFGLFLALCDFVIFR